MAGINKVIVLGNLGRDPEFRSAPNGATSAKFSVAASESYKNKEGNWVEETEWINVIAWRYLAEKSKNLKKGSQVYVEGKLKTTTYEENGVKKYFTQVEAEKIMILDKRDSRDSQAQEERPSSDPSANPSDDLPF